MTRQTQLRTRVTVGALLAALRDIPPESPLSVGGVPGGEYVLTELALVPTDSGYRVVLLAAEGAAEWQQT